MMLSIGCESEVNQTSPAPLKEAPPRSVRAFAPVRIQIIALSDITASNASLNEARVSAYVDLLDAYDSQLKAPGSFRFELYEYIQRSSDPKGTGLINWPGINLNHPETNDEYWQNDLRAYQFDLEVDYYPSGVQTFVLVAIFTTPEGKRLTDEHILQFHE